MMMWKITNPLQTPRIHSSIVSYGRWGRYYSFVLLTSEASIVDSCYTYMDSTWVTIFNLMEEVLWQGGISKWLRSGVSSVKALFANSQT